MLIFAPQATRELGAAIARALGAGLAPLGVGVGAAEECHLVGECDAGICAATLTGLRLARDGSSYILEPAG